MTADEARKILGVGQEATREEINRAYKKQIKAVHPTTVDLTIWRQRSMPREAFCYGYVKISVNNTCACLIRVLEMWQKHICRQF